MFGSILDNPFVNKVISLFGESFTQRLFVTIVAVVAPILLTEQTTTIIEGKTVDIRLIEQINSKYEYQLRKNIKKDIKEEANELLILTDFIWTLKDPAGKKTDIIYQYILGAVYYTGAKGVPQNYSKAVNWFHKAAEQGYAPAQYILGVIYHEGQGIPQNYSNAVKWYRKAAEQEYVHAQYSLGWMYGHGEGVPQGYSTMLKWYRKAAKQKHLKAQYNLGVVYANIQGVPKNFIYAYMWLSIAKANGIKDKDIEELLKKVKSKLSPAEIAKAQDLAERCFESGYKDCG